VTDEYPAAWNSSFSKHWATIAPNETVSEEFQVKPTAAERVRIGRITYTYDARRGMGEPEFDVQIESARAYARRTDPHLVQWVLTAVLALAAVATPCAMWLRAKRRQQQQSKEKEK
jgi:hypothetical protein